MSLQSWSEVLVSSSVDSVPITNTVTQASCIPPSAKFPIPGTSFWQPGKVLRIKAKGRVSCVATTPGTLAFQVLFTPTPVAVFNPGLTAMALNTVAKTDVAWWLEIEMVCRTIGQLTTATLLGQSQWTSEAVVGSPIPTVGSAGTLMVPASTPAVGNGFDSTAGQLVDLQAKFSVATATTSLTTHSYMLIAEN
jgi:hypothetical protein